MRRSALPTVPLPVGLLSPMLIATVAGLLGALLAALLAAPAARASVPATARAQQRTPVVLVHGYGDTAASLDGLEDYLHAQGWLFSDLAEFGYDWAATNESNATRFGAFLSERFGSRQVDVVAHSMGSLLTRKYLKDGGSSRVRAWVSLGGPNHGAGDAAPCGPFAGFCDIHAASLADMTPGSAFLNEPGSPPAVRAAPSSTTASPSPPTQLPAPCGTATGPAPPPSPTTTPGSAWTTPPGARSSPRRRPSPPTSPTPTTAPGTTTT